MMERRRRRTRTQRRRANARPQLLHLPSVNYSPAEEVGRFSPRLLQDQRARSQKDRGLVAPCSPDWQREVKGGRSIIHEAGPSGRPEGPESVWGSTVSVCLSVWASERVCVCVCVLCSYCCLKFSLKFQDFMFFNLTLQSEKHFLLNVSQRSAEQLKQLQTWFKMPLKRCWISC